MRATLHGAADSLHYVRCKLLAIANNRQVITVCNSNSYAIANNLQLVTVRVRLSGWDRLR
jgi:hypothetical protein